MDEKHKSTKVLLGELILNTKRKTNVLRGYLFQCVLAVIALIVLVTLAKSNNTVQDQQKVTIWDKNWTVIENGQAQFYETLPNDIYTDTQELILRKQIDKKEYIGENILAFMTFHDQVIVLIDGTEIYRFDNDSMKFSKSSGHCTHFIEMQKEYLGKTIEIRLKYPYPTKKIAVPTFNLGKYRWILNKFFLSRIPAIVVSSFMLIIGVLLLIFYLTFRGTKKINSRLAWIGLFSIVLGIWSIVETQIPALIVKTRVAPYFLSFISIKLLFVPGAQFCIDTFSYIKNKKFINSLCIVNFFDLVITTILQITGIYDYKQTLWITHAYMAIGVLYVLGSLLIGVVKNKTYTIRINRKNFVNYIGIGLVMCCVLLDVYAYYKNPSNTDSATFSRVALLVYIIALTIRTIRSSLHLLEVEKEAEILKDEALRDPVTRLGNRTAFQLDMVKIAEAAIGHWGVVMCDLNGLKYFNDHYGHSMGDSYIIICAELICDVFSEYGKTYRIGGDEFVVLVKDMPYQRFELLYEQMNERIEVLSKSYFEERMGVAAGYAMFDAQMDRDLSDTEKRADELMYSKKQQMKKENPVYCRE